MKVSKKMEIREQYFVLQNKDGEFLHTRNDSVGTLYFMDEFRTCHKFKDSKSLNQFLNSIYGKSMFPQEFENIVARKVVIAFI